MNQKASNPNYKPAKLREEEIRLALIRIQKGRSHTGETKITIAAVAREAGVSTALIHNYYPQIADKIREAQGRSHRDKQDDEHIKLISERKKSAAYRSEIQQLQCKISKLASINEMLIEENRILRHDSGKNKVIHLSPY
ncbi:TetR family transcriptional regulator [Pseudomonas putida]|uniref:TetR family transcriptional regulator n=1 Tax=Pseudomonas putida TaxID=303 RepID=UPI00216A7AFC|nr:TetR family transcriptional regulator [Pseudomonas putida]MCS4065480.1 hypothetical protein [Pseudomonas putida]